MNLNDRQNNGTVNLPLAPMADVFIVILIFILKSFAADPSALGGASELSLPTASGKEATQAELKIEISPDSIVVNERKLASLFHYAFLPADLDAEGNPKTISASLEKIIPELKADQKSPPITIYADKTAPYSLIRSVMNMTAATGVKQIQIAVTGEN